MSVSTSAQILLSLFEKKNVFLSFIENKFFTDISGLHIYLCTTMLKTSEINYPIMQSIVKIEKSKHSNQSVGKEGRRGGSKRRERD